VSDDVRILVVGALLAVGLLASLVAGRVRVPALVLFLGVGMVLGSDVTGLIAFSNYDLARTIGTIALGLILFEGGLSQGPAELRSVLKPATALATVGTLLTAAITAAAAMLIFGLSLLEGLLVGAVLSSTDGAAIFALLRNSTLKRRLARTLEAESGLNDPIAVLLVLGFVSWLTEPGYGIGDMLVLLVRQLGIGLAAGVLVGWCASRIAPRLGLGAGDGLYPVFSLATAALAFGLAGSLHGSGFLAVYLAGIGLASRGVPAKRTLIAFHGGAAWVAQITLFLVLGLLVYPSQFDSIVLRDTLLALVLAVIARPVAVYVSMLPFDFTFREKTVLGWAGLRGAVPVVLATFPVTEGVEGGVDIFNVVFFAVLVSTILQGTTFEPLAKRLGLTTTEPAVPPPLMEAGAIRSLGAEILEFPVREGDAAAGVRIRDLGLSRDALVNVVVRGEDAIPPRGDTRILPGDRLYVLLRDDDGPLNEDPETLRRRWREGPLGRSAIPRPDVEMGHVPLFSVWSWSADREGDPARPELINGVRPIHQLRVRHDEPGGLWLLADGRYGVTGPVAVIGARRDVGRWARRRIVRPATGEDERAWLRSVIGAVATDID
jgi:cell volume regulation protein A